VKIIMKSLLPKWNKMKKVIIFGLLMGILLLSGCTQTEGVCEEFCNGTFRAYDPIAGTTFCDVPPNHQDKGYHNGVWMVCE